MKVRKKIGKETNKKIGKETNIFPRKSSKYIIMKMWGISDHKSR